jgi:hypothetical protein
MKGIYQYFFLSFFCWLSPTTRGIIMMHHGMSQAPTTASHNYPPLPKNPEPFRAF